jgi:hypothetical protein
MRHLVEFEVHGKDQAELEERAESTLNRFVRSGWEIDYSLEARAEVVEQSAGDVRFWTATVQAAVTPASAAPTVPAPSSSSRRSAHARRTARGGDEE